MGYYRLPDTFAFSMKTVAAGNASVGCYCRLGSWAAESRSEGFVPTDIANMIGSRKELDALQRHGLLEAVAVGEVRFVTRRVGSKKPDAEVVMPADGFWMVDYLIHNLTRREGEALSDERRKAGREGGLARAANKANDQAIASANARANGQASAQPPPRLRRPAGA